MVRIKGTFPVPSLFRACDILLFQHADRASRSADPRDETRYTRKILDTCKFQYSYSVTQPGLAAQLLDPWDDFDRVFGQFPGICHAVSCPMYPGAWVPVRYQILVGLLPKLSGP